MEEHDSFSFDHNVVFWVNDSPLFNGHWDDEHFKMDENIYWNPNHPDISFNGKSLAAWQSENRRDLHSQIIDPGFKDPENHDFSFADDSPAALLGLTFPQHFGPTRRPTLLDDIPAPDLGFVLPQ